MAAAPYRMAPPRRLSAPVLPVRNTVLLPGQTLELLVGRRKSLAAVAAASGSGGELLVVGQTADGSDEPDPAKGDLAAVGTAGRIVQIIRLSDHSVVTVQGARRVRLVGYPQCEPFLLADAEEIDGDPDMVELELDSIWQRFAAYAEARGLPANPPGALGAERVADLIAGRLWVSIEERQRLLEAATHGARLALIEDILRRDTDRPPDARVLERPVQIDLGWTGPLPSAGSRALGVAIAALGWVGSLVEARSALLFSIPPGGDEASVRQFAVTRDRVDSRAMRDLVTQALGRRPQSALGRFIWPRSEPVFLPVLRVARARLRVPRPLGGDGRFELDTPVGRVVMACEVRGEETWVGTPDDPDDPADEHLWEPIRIELRVAEDVRIRLWSRWALWGRGEEPLLLPEVAAALCRRSGWQIVDQD